MRYFGSFSARSSSSRDNWPRAIGSAPRMSRATSPSAMPFTSKGCRPQKSAICSKVIEVLSTNQTAVAFGIRIWSAILGLRKQRRPAFRPGGVENEYRRLNPRWKRANPASNRQHHLAEVRAAFQQRMGFGRLGQREGAVHDRLHLAGFDPGPDHSFDLGREPGLLVSAA